jgi:hypothetical protein
MVPGPRGSSGDVGGKEALRTDSGGLELFVEITA